MFWACGRQVVLFLSGELAWTHLVLTPRIRGRGFMRNWNAASASHVASGELDLPDLHSSMMFCRAGARPQRST